MFTLHVLYERLEPRSVSMRTSVGYNKAVYGGRSWSYLQSEHYICSACKWEVQTAN